jgi:hypothetical protein
MVATRYGIDPGRSSVAILATSSVHDIHAEAPGPSGWIELSGTPGRFGPKTTLTGRIEVAAGGLSADNPLVEREMKRRIDARRHPVISGEATGVEGASGDEVELTGEITFLGRPCEVTGTVAVTAEGEGVRVTGSQILDVRVWGLKPPKLLMLKVHPEVTVTIDLVAT